MKYITNTILMSLALVSLWSCTVQDIQTYEGKPQAYFFRKSIQSKDPEGRPDQKDSLAQTFFTKKSSVMFDTIYVVVNTMGALSEIDRPVKLLQTNVGKELAAVAGTHYVAFDDPALAHLMVVPAGKTFALLPVIITRTESMKDNVFRIELEIVENEYFDKGIKDNLKFLIKTTAMAAKPTKWDTFWKNIFGATWGSVKMQLIIDTLGEVEWENPPLTDTQYSTWMKNMVTQALADYNAAHPDAPLTEANGKPVDMSK